MRIALKLSKFVLKFNISNFTTQENLHASLSHQSFLNTLHIRSYVSFRQNKFIFLKLTWNKLVYLGFLSFPLQTDTNITSERIWERVNQFTFIFSAIM